MGRRKYIDFGLINEVPNKYNLTIKSIKKLKVNDWGVIKKKCWQNIAMSKEGNWWCHLEGCQNGKKEYDDFSEFWIGFNEKDNSVDCHFTTYEGMCSYIFDNFYDIKEIENQADMNVQVNALRFVNNLIDKGALK